MQLQQSEQQTQTEPLILVLKEQCRRTHTELIKRWTDNDAFLGEETTSDKEAYYIVVDGNSERFITNDDRDANSAGGAAHEVRFILISRMQKS